MSIIIFIKIRFRVKDLRVKYYKNHIYKHKIKDI